MPYKSKKQQRYMNAVHPDIAARWNQYPIPKYQASSTNLPFDPEGTNYDMESAIKAGLKADSTGHWPSRDPITGMILKGKNHPTYHKTIKGEKAAGYVIEKGEDGRYYSFPKKQKGGSLPSYQASLTSIQPDTAHWMYEEGKLPMPEEELDYRQDMYEDSARSYGYSQSMMDEISSSRKYSKKYNREFLPNIRQEHDKIKGLLEDLSTDIKPYGYSTGKGDSPEGKLIPGETGSYYYPTYDYKVPMYSAPKGKEPETKYYPIYPEEKQSQWYRDMKRNWSKGINYVNEGLDYISPDWYLEGEQKLRDWRDKKWEEYFGDPPVQNYYDAEGSGFSESHGYTKEMAERDRKASYFSRENVERRRKEQEAKQVAEKKEIESKYEKINFPTPKVPITPTKKNTTSDSIGHKDRGQGLQQSENWYIDSAGKKHFVRPAEYKRLKGLGVIEEKKYGGSLPKYQASPATIGSPYNYGWDTGASVSGDAPIISQEPGQSLIEQSPQYKGMIEADKLSKGELTGTGKAEALHGLNDPIFNALLLGAPASLGLGAKASSKLVRGLGKGFDYVNPVSGFGFNPGQKLLDVGNKVINHPKFYPVANQIAKVVSKNPITKKLYKDYAFKIASQSGLPSRSGKDIVDVLMSGPKTTLSDIRYVGEISGRRGSDSIWGRKGRNLLQEYIYGNSPGLTKSNIKHKGLGEYTKRYGDLKTYKLDDSIWGKGPLTMSGKKVNNKGKFLKNKQLPFREKLKEMERQGKSEKEILEMRNILIEKRKEMELLQNPQTSNLLEEIRNHIIDKPEDYYSQILNKALKGFKHGSKGYYKKLGETIKKHKKITIQSQDGILGRDNIAGHLMTLKHTPKKGFQVETQDIWKFTPEDYAPKWSKRSLHGTEIEKRRKGKKYVQKTAAQAGLMDKAGKPFVMNDVRPLYLKKHGGLIPSYQAASTSITGYQGKGPDSGPYIIPDNNITMDGVGFPLKGTPINALGKQTGKTQLMKPGKNYKFPPGSSVYETPIMKDGGQLPMYFGGGDVNWGQALGSTASMAAAGSAFGPVGTAVGGVVGLGTSLVGQSNQFKADEQAQADWDAAQEQRTADAKQFSALNQYINPNLSSKPAIDYGGSWQGLQTPMLNQGGFNQSPDFGTPFYQKGGSLPSYQAAEADIPLFGKTLPAIDIYSEPGDLGEYEEKQRRKQRGQRFNNFLYNVKKNSEITGEQIGEFLDFPGMKRAATDPMGSLKGVGNTLADIGGFISSGSVPEAISKVTNPANRNIFGNEYGSGLSKASDALSLATAPFSAVGAEVKLALKGIKNLAKLPAITQKLLPTLSPSRIKELSKAFNTGSRPKFLPDEMRSIKDFMTGGEEEVLKKAAKEAPSNIFVKPWDESQAIAFQDRGRPINVRIDDILHHNKVLEEITPGFVPKTSGGIYSGNKMIGFKQERFPGKNLVEIENYFKSIPNKNELRKYLNQGISEKIQEVSPYGIDIGNIGYPNFKIKDMITDDQFRQLVSDFKKIHKKGEGHFDPHKGNIMMTPNFDLKLIDPRGLSGMSKDFTNYHIPKERHLINDLYAREPHLRSLWKNQKGGKLPSYQINDMGPPYQVPTGPLVTKQASASPIGGYDTRIQPGSYDANTGKMGYRGQTVQQLWDNPDALNRGDVPMNNPNANLNTSTVPNMFMGYDQMGYNQEGGDLPEYQRTSEDIPNYITDRTSNVFFPERGKIRGPEEIEASPYSGTVYKDPNYQITIPEWIPKDPFQKSMEDNAGGWGKKDSTKNPFPSIPKYKGGGGLSRKKDYGSKKKPYPSVSSGNFAGGGRSYPIPTRADAVDALRLAGLHGRSDVKAKVYKKYPGLKKKQQGGDIYNQQNPHQGATFEAERPEVVKHEENNHPIALAHGGTVNNSSNFTRLTGNRHSDAEGGGQFKGAEGGFVYSDFIKIPKEIEEQFKNLV